MKIEFTLEENYSFFLNESIKRLIQALGAKKEDYYKFAVIFSATAIELGLVIIARDLLNEKENIYYDNGRTRPITHIIKKCIKPRISEVSNKHMRGFTYWDEELSCEKNLFQINNDSLQKHLVNNLIDKRNEILHSKGGFDSDLVVESIFTSLMMLNCCLPGHLSFNEVLGEDNINHLLENEFFINTIKNFLHDVVIVENTEDYSGILPDSGICDECDNNSLLIIDAHKPCYFCLICCENGYLVECDLCSQFKFPSEVNKWNDSGTSYACEYCCDHLLK